MKNAHSPNSNNEHNNLLDKRSISLDSQAIVIAKPKENNNNNNNWATANNTNGTMRSNAESIIPIGFEWFEELGRSHAHTHTQTYNNLLILQCEQRQQQLAT